MSLEIIESCVNCYACEPLCPNDAIYQAAPHFLTDPDKCTECVGDFDDAQCASICPIEGAIVDEPGVAMNLRGSLTGNVNVSERIDIRHGGSVVGDVAAHSVSIEEGAYFKGSIDMRRPESARHSAQSVATSSSPKPVEPEQAKAVPA